MMRWSKRQKEYIEWCATPRDEREPPTQAEMADVLGVTDRTLRRWQNRPGFWIEVDNQIKAWVGRRTPDILRAQVTKAISGGKEGDGDVPAAKLVLGYAGKYEEKKGGDTNVLIFQQGAQAITDCYRELLGGLIALYVPEDERGNAWGYVRERVEELTPRIIEAIPVEGGVFRPLLQDKK